MSNASTVLFSATGALSHWIRSPRDTQEGSHALADGPSMGGVGIGDHQSPGEGPGLIVKRRLGGGLETLSNWSTVGKTDSVG